MKDGRVPFISVEDIAQAAYDALVSKESPNKDYYIVGPELFSYDEVSESTCMNEYEPLNFHIGRRTFE